MKKRNFAAAVCAAALVVALGHPGPASSSTSGSSSYTFATASKDADWEVVSPNPGDVYIDMNGNVLPKDADGYPLDRPQGREPRAEELGEAAPGSSVSIGPCTPVSGRDNPHRSSTGFAASGHGWWDKGDCSNNRAKVYNCLYMKHQADGYWYQKDCSSTKTLKPGGGSSNRTVARAECEHYDVRSWRNHVDVDVVDEWDTGEKPMREASFVCRT